MEEALLLGGRGVVTKLLFKKDLEENTFKRMPSRIIAGTVASSQVDPLRWMLPVTDTAPNGFDREHELIRTL